MARRAEDQCGYRQEPRAHIMRAEVLSCQFDTLQELHNWQRAMTKEAYMALVAVVVPVLTWGLDKMGIHVPRWFYGIIVVASLSTLVVAGAMTYSNSESTQKPSATPAHPASPNHATNPPKDGADGEVHIGGNNSGNACAGHAKCQQGTVPKPLPKPPSP